MHKEIKCVGCQKVLTYFDKAIDPSQSWYNEAAVDKFLPGYGSRHDMSLLLVGFCDDCLDKLINEGIIHELL